MRQRAFIHFNQPVLATFNALAREIERDFEQQGLGRPFNKFSEKEDAFYASYDLPGVNPEDINIEMEDDRLTISAVRKDPFAKDNEGKKYEQVFSMPKNIDVEKINADYQYGVLTLTLPKLAEVKTKKKILVTTHAHSQMEEVVHAN